MPAITTIAQLEAIYGSPDETSTIKEVDRQTRAFLRIVLPLLVPALISCWLFGLLAGGACRLPHAAPGRAGLPGRGRRAVHFWNNGQIGELAALGFVWTVFMTVFCVAFLVLARRYQLPVA
jgi:ABC-type spermidine/putrescine transport system permease subunit I